MRRRQARPLRRACRAVRRACRAGLTRRPRLRPLVAWALRPSPAANDPERRRARFLSVLLACLGLLAGLALVASLLDGSHPARVRRAYILLTGLTLLLLLAARALNRSGRYHLAAHLTMTLAVLAPWAAILLDPSVRAGDFAPPLFLGLSVMLATILLPERVTIALAITQMSGYLTLLALTPAYHSLNWPSLALFTLTLAMLSVITSILTRDDIRQIEQQNQLLLTREAQLRELSVRDPLTGVFNRRYLEETLERELRRAGRKQQNVGVILIDIDHFKCVNDRYGHAAGDEALRRLAERFRLAVRGSDIVCRYGGEEFVFMLPEATLEITQRRADAIRQDVQALRLLWEGRALEAITLSLGVAVYPEHGEDGHALLAAADAALYRAKRLGRNRVEAAAPARLF